jgi:hypothetical protein
MNLPPNNTPSICPENIAGYVPSPSSFLVTERIGGTGKPGFSNLAGTERPATSGACPPEETPAAPDDDGEDWREGPGTVPEGEEWDWQEKEGVTA